MSETNQMVIPDVTYKPKIKIQMTSLLAWADVLENLGERQRLVYKIIHDNQPINNTQISHAANLPINSIVPRTNELRKKGIVRLDHKGICPITGKLTMFWRCFRRL